MSARFERDGGEKRSGRLPAGPAHACRGLEAGSSGAERELWLAERSDPKAKQRARTASSTASTATHE
jgi:hypothetical protein